MTGTFLHFLGGLGLFLLGMVVLTDGLRALAGDKLNRVLLRLTKNPWTGALSGAWLTALVQSSSATSVAAIGFVNAGLMSFPQALGILFGANVGTTVTGWLVALVGFKLELGTIVLPGLLVGALLRLFSTGRLRHGGWALAGFALVFLGIELMQLGLERFEDVVTPSQLPADTIGGRLLLVGIGIGITLVTQSSSAGVATALTALHAGAISFDQAAAMVIGMDVGTTSTTAVATVGGTVSMRRAGYSHVVFNLMTGVAAFLVVGPYTHVVEAFVDGGVGAHPELALVGFHSSFNVLGTLAVLPFTRAFERLMVRLVPDRDDGPSRRLDRRLLGDPAAATVALVAAVRELTGSAAEAIEARLDPAAEDVVPSVPTDPSEDERALDDLRAFASRIAVDPPRPDTVLRYRAMTHCLDHLERLLHRCRQAERAATVRGARPPGALARHADVARRAVAAAGVTFRTPGAAIDPRPLADVSDALAEAQPTFRAETLRGVPAESSLSTALERLDAMRWLHRSVYHAWRIAVHLEVASRVGARAGLDERLQAVGEQEFPAGLE